jgi:hypothetical protein
MEYSELCGLMLNRLWRYGYGADKRVPYSQTLVINFKGEDTRMQTSLHGRYFFVVDDTHLRIVDPAGAGVIMSYEIRLINSLQLFAEESV